MPVKLVYTELYYDDFQRPDENPLDPARWVVPPVAPGNDELQIVNHEACTTRLYQADGQEVFRPALPVDQYCEIVLGNIVNSDLPGPVQYENIPLLYVRAGYAPNNFANLTPCYVAYLFNDANGVGWLDVYQIDLDISVPFNVGPIQVPTWICGDKFTVAVVGNYASGNIYVSRNGVLILTVPLSTSPTYIDAAVTLGRAGLQLSQTVSSDNTSPPTNTVDISITRWAAGSVNLVDVPSNYSVPDCRAIAPAPNASRNVNGTLIYDAQISSNPAVPSKDSRAAGVPVASGTYPQNSRAPGVYGPGE